MTPADLQAALDAALAGNWHKSHEIAQRDESDPLACWIHAVLHKIEGDVANSRYWYARTAHDYGEWADPRAELGAIRQSLRRGGI